VVTLKQWRELHAKKDHRSFFDVKIGEWHVHRCSCGSKFFVPDSEHKHGEQAAGTEKN
jgi:hypothetical protein